MVSMRRTRTWFVFLVLSCILPATAAAQRLKVDASVEELERAAAADSNDAVAHYNLALGYWSEERYEEAGAALDAAMRLDPRFAPAFLAKAYLPFAIQPELWDEVYEERLTDDSRTIIEESDRLYRYAFMVDPLLELRIVSAVVPPKSVLWTVTEGLARFYNDWLQGFDDFRKNDFEAAYFRFGRMVDRLERGGDFRWVPESLLWFRGLAAAHIGRNEEALSDFRYLLEQSLAEESGEDLVHVPLGTNNYRYMVAFLQQRSGELSAAESMYREAVQHNLGLFMAHVRLAEIHEARQEWQAALEERRAAIRSNPDDPTLLVDLALTQVKTGRVGDAVETLQMAIERKPRETRPYYLLGLIHSQRGETHAAREAFEQFVELAPSRYEPQKQDASRRLEAL